jgi:SAM-dependent methyltransferase
MALVGKLHQQMVFSRRTKVLAQRILDVLPADCKTMLDVGCGDGTIDNLILQDNPRLAITGVDVLVRPNVRFPVQAFDGIQLPFVDKSFDVVLFVDVLHHTDDPMVLLREALRVAKSAILLKDHMRDGAFAYNTLRFMDWVGNAHHNVVLPYNYWRRSQWMRAFETLGLSIGHWNERLGLYPPPASLVFERKLHFVAQLALDAGSQHAR